MSFLDGELSERRTLAVRSHLALCGQCRKTVQDFAAVRARFSSAALLPEFPEPGMPQVNVSSITEASATKSARVPGWGWRSSLAASIALILGAFLSWHTLVTPPSVSARDLIARARSEERVPLYRAAGKQVERTLRVTRRSGGVVEASNVYRETLRALPGGEIAVSGGAPMFGAIMGALPVARCSDMDPLSARMMECLAQDPSASVRLLNAANDSSASEYRLSIENLQPLRGHPFTSAWTLRLSDWRVTRADYRVLRTAANVEFTFEEVGYRVLEAPVVANETLAARVTTNPRTDREGVELAAGRRLFDVAIVKAELLLALHALGLKPEDDLEIKAEDELPIAVHAIVADEERKVAFQTALSALNGVRATVLSYADAVEVSQQQAQTSPVPARAATQRLRSAGPLLLEELSAHFGGGPDGRRQALVFGDSILEQVSAMRFQARWLVRLRRTLSEAERSRLPIYLRRDLAKVESVVAGELLSRHDALRADVEAVLCPNWCQPADGFEIDSIPENAEPGDLDDQDLAASMDKEFTLLKVLFVDLSFAEGKRTSHDNAALLQRALEWRDAHSGLHGLLLRALPAEATADAMASAQP